MPSNSPHSAACPVCASALRITDSQDQDDYCCSRGHTWTAEALAVEHPLTILPSNGEQLPLVTADHAWMLRPARGDDAGWTVDVTVDATNEDVLLFDRLFDDGTRCGMFDTPEHALQELGRARAQQVRIGQVWRSVQTHERVVVTACRPSGLEPDATIYVRSLDDPESAWSLDKFRSTHQKLSDHVPASEEQEPVEEEPPYARVAEALKRMRRGCASKFSTVPDPHRTNSPLIHMLRRR